MHVFFLELVVDLRLRLLQIWDYFIALNALIEDWKHKYLSDEDILAIPKRKTQRNTSTNEWKQM